LRNPGKNQKKLSKEIVTFEQNSVANNYKWGVLYVKEGQAENDIYSNVDTSPAFEDFLKFLGEKIPLKGWSRFRGGLDNKKDSTGTHSIYTQFHDMEIMFHVAPLLPYYPNDPQQLERKRHLGNDIIVIVFKEGKGLFTPEIMKSEFNHIFVVVSVADKSITGSDKVHYKLELAVKEGVPPFGPPAVWPAVFERTPSFRDYLLLKLINGERAALHGCPNFRNKMMTVRRTNLETLHKGFGKKSKD